jgi:hypothetical protein
MEAAGWRERDVKSTKKSEKSAVMGRCGEGGSSRPYWFPITEAKVPLYLLLSNQLHHHHILSINPFLYSVG